MRLHAPSHRRGDGWVAAVAELEDRERPGAPALELRVDENAVDGAEIDLGASPFVPVAAVAALFAGQDLEIEVPVARSQLDGVRSATRRLAGWFDLRVPDLRAPTLDPDPAPSDERGLFFTRGVDSWTSLLGLRADLTHLLFIDGAEPLHSPPTRAAVIAAVRDVATARGLSAVVVTTNARSRLDELAPWDHTHGAALASAALLVSKVLGEVHVASSHPANRPTPWGTHPDLDPCWSTPSTRFVHDPVRLSRWEKTATIAAHQPALDSLHVCWQGGTADNCGRCRKCLLTMSTLDALGALERCQRFDRIPRPVDIEALPSKPASRSTNVLEVIDRLPDDSELGRAFASIVDPWDLEPTDLRPRRGWRFRARRAKRPGR